MRNSCLKLNHPFRKTSPGKMACLTLNLLVVYKMVVLKHFAPWDKFWCEGVETFLDKKLSDFFDQNI